MKQKIAFTLDKVARGNRSDYLNKPFIPTAKAYTRS